MAATWIGMITVVVAAAVEGATGRRAVAMTVT